METKLPAFHLRGYSFAVTVTIPDGADASGNATANINVHAPGAPTALSRSVAEFMGLLLKGDGLADFVTASANAKEKAFAKYEYSRTPEASVEISQTEEDDPPPLKCERCGKPSYGPWCDACEKAESEKAEKLTNTPVCCARCERTALPIELVDSKEIGAAICIECLRAIEPPAKAWQKEPITEKQRAMLEGHGIRPEFVAALSKGEASRYIGQIIRGDEPQAVAAADPATTSGTQPCTMCRRQTEIANLVDLGHAGRLVCSECRDFLKR